MLENTTTTLGEKPYEGIGLGDTMLQNNNYSPKIQQIFKRISHLPPIHHILGWSSFFYFFENIQLLLVVATLYFHFHL
jgi:hypothetical protein